MAVRYFTWGRWAEAEPHFFAALEGRRAVLGRLDPATWGAIGHRVDGYIESM